MVSQVKRNQILQSIAEIQRDQPDEAVSMVLEHIKPIGISALRYRNLHEGNGEFSYCVVDPSNVTVKEYCKIEHTD